MEKGPDPFIITSIGTEMVLNFQIFKGGFL